ncbi:hypothetical protein [Delftia lacustris]|uniref:Uncharacterized protein n=1 Tax=Delftia lacustris TaxID=558537 RepID=A0A1H3TUB2_9BURK|nr:hypothetical protein [Delftia lacustris]SDZ53712.1 hypothetical protein SAMN05421547_13278 [Delftia lacustris]
MTPPIQLQRLPRRKKPARQRAFFMVALVPVVLLLAAMAGCSQAGAQDPQPTAQEQRIARAAARACEGLTPVFENGSHTCHKEIP